MYIEYGYSSQNIPEYMSSIHPRIEYMSSFNIQKKDLLSFVSGKVSVFCS